MPRLAPQNVNTVHEQHVRRARTDHVTMRLHRKSNAPCGCVAGLSIEFGAMLADVKATTSSTNIELHELSKRPEMLHGPNAYTCLAKHEAGIS